MFPSKLRLVRWSRGQTIEVMDDGRDKSVIYVFRSIVTQAMRDGMLRVAVGVDPGTRESWMKYYGPSSWSEPMRTWWDMVPPPARMFPRLFRCAMAMTRLRDAFPPEGTIRGGSGPRAFTLFIRFPVIYGFEIAWPPKLASALHSAEGGLPEPKTRAASAGGPPWPMVEPNCEK